jgi:hypothetical protein
MDYYDVAVKIGDSAERATTTIQYIIHAFGRRAVNFKTSSFNLA